MLDGRTERLVSAVGMVGTGSVLGLASWLQASPIGHGTHRQLGLGVCTFLALTGQPCPMCGMTTTFTLLAHGNVISAVITQPFGLVLFSMTVGAFCVSLAELVQPRGRWSRFLDWLEPRESRLASAFLIAMGLGWLYKMLIMAAAV